MNSHITPLRRIAASLTALVFLMSSTFSVHASIASEMQSLMDDAKNLPEDVAKGLSEVPGDIKGSIMLSKPSAIRGQTYGTLMGGRAYARFPVRNLQLANIQMPHFSAGCGGIDMTFGSLSIIKGDKIVDFLKATAMNAVGVITQVAISAITPLLGDALKWAMDKVDKINGFNLNSCEVAQKGVAGAMNLTTENEATECVNNRMVYDGMDRQEAKDECKSRTKLNEGLAKGPEEARVFYGNIMWELLKKTLKDDPGTKEERELIMSMTGTIVYFPNGTAGAPGASNGSALSPDTKAPENTSVTPTPQPYPAMLTDLSHLIYGNGDSADATKETKETIPLKVYDCGEDKACLNPTVKTRPQGSFSAKVQKELQSIADKIRGHIPLGAAEELIINQTSLPVYKMMSLGTELEGSFLAEQMIDKYKDVIAADFAYIMLARNIQAGTTTMKKKVIKLNAAQESDLKEILQYAIQTRQALQQQHEEFAKKVADMSAIGTVLQNLERAMTTNMPDRVLALTAPGGPGGTGNK